MKNLLFLALIFGAAACVAKKETAKPEVATTQKAETAVRIETEILKGRWQWVSSTFISRGMSEPTVSTPDSRGYNVVLIFNESHVEIIKDGASLGMMPYRVELSGTEMQMLWVDMPVDDFPFFVSSGPVYLRNDELYISGGYNDAGENQTYKHID